MGLVDVDKTYNIPCFSMTEAQWDGLVAVYAALPGYLGFSEEEGCPGWFGWPPVDGQDEGVAYLVASAEPSGLVVAGQLPPEVWAAWDSTFMELASGVLGFRVRDACD